MGVYSQILTEHISEHAGGGDFWTSVGFKYRRKNLEGLLGEAWTTRVVMEVRIEFFFDSCEVKVLIHQCKIDKNICTDLLETVCQ